MNRRILEFLCVGMAVALVIALMFARRPKADQESPEKTHLESTRALRETKTDFHWSTQGEGYEYYFEAHQGEWTALLCSQNPMGNYVTRGKGEGSLKLQAQQALEQLIGRQAAREVPDFGLAFPVGYWHKHPRYGLSRSFLWADNYFTNEFPNYGELLADEDLILLFQDIGTNGGHRTDFKLRNSGKGELEYEIFVPKPVGPFRATGRVSQTSWQNMLQLIQEKTKARIQSGVGTIWPITRFFIVMNRAHTTISSTVSRNRALPRSTS